MHMHKRLMRAHKGWAALTLLLGWTACGSDSGQCVSDADCPGGVCVALAASRECRPVVGADLSTAAAADLGTDDSSFAQGDAAFGLDAIAASCTFNNDGVIDRAEEPFLVGLGALFVVNPGGSTVAVSLNAVGNTWDFTGSVPNERKSFDQLVSPAGAWWAADFPSATYAELLDDGQAIFGVYRATANALQLLGVVSEQGGVQKTELTYATPIDVLKFPLQVGSSWTSESDVSGFASGIGFFAHEKYTFAVDARGTTKVAAGTFDTLRLRTNYTQTVGFAVTTRVLYLHLAECYGAVARIRSRDNETSNDFTQATEYRRLTTQ